MKDYSNNYSMIEPDLIHPIGKRSQKVSERIQPMEKKNQAAYALAFFENSNEIQKLFAYPA